MNEQMPTPRYEITDALSACCDLELDRCLTRSWNFLLQALALSSTSMWWFQDATFHKNGDEECIELIDLGAARSVRRPPG